MAAEPAKLGTLSWKDVGKAIIMAFLGAFVTSVYTIIQDGHFPTGKEFGTAALMGAGAAVAYLIKNIFTNSQDQFATKEPGK